MRRLLAILILAALPSLGAATFVQAALYSNATNTNSVSTSITTPTVGNTLYAFVWGSGGSAFTISGVTDNQSTPNSYTISIQGPSNAYNVAIACAPIVTSSGIFTVTATTSANSYLSLSVHEYSGMTCTQDGTDSRQAVGTTTAYGYATTGFTTTNANDLILAGMTTAYGGNVGAFVAGAAGHAYTIPVNGEQDNGASYGAGASEYYIASSTATFTPQFTHTYEHNDFCVSAAYKAVSSGGARRRVIVIQ